ncbi:MAG TPA: hypothetical protein VKK19_02195 [Candidatus Dormibacteraeota bacterium]|nr:hypothetical protein [Candidatus Dormibacteraeota bacterium]
MVERPPTGGIFSGLKAENVAVGLVAAHAGAPDLALGAVFGGGMFVVCVALGLGAVLFPPRVHLPAGVLVDFALTPVMAGGRPDMSAGNLVGTVFTSCSSTSA